MAHKLDDYLKWCAEKYTTLKPRSIHQVQQYLLRKARGWSLRNDPDVSPEYVDECIQTTIQTLLENNILNDDRYAQWYLSEKQYFKPRGKTRIKYELLAKGVDTKVIDVVLEANSVSDAELIDQLMQTRFAKVDLNDRDTQAKVVRRLQQKGFRYTDIQKALERAIEESS